MANDIPVPDFLDINPEVQEAAKAAMNQDRVLKVPEFAKGVKGKNDEEYFRWAEVAVVDNAWRETNSNGLISAVVQLRVRVGSHNGGARLWARHTMNPWILAGNEPRNEKEKNHTFMNDRAINAISTLLAATGLQPDTGGISSKLLNYLFPAKNSPGAVTPLRGKTVVMNLVDQPNKGAKATTDRQTQVESYLPSEGA